MDKWEPHRNKRSANFRAHQAVVYSHTHSLTEVCQKPNKTWFLFIEIVSQMVWTSVFHLQWNGDEHSSSYMSRQKERTFGKRREMSVLNVKGLQNAAWHSRCLKEQKVAVGAQTLEPGSQVGVLAVSHAPSTQSLCRSSVSSGNGAAHCQPSLCAYYKVLRRILGTG